MNAGLAAQPTRPRTKSPSESIMNELEKELATLMIGELNLEDIQPESVSADTPLYGDGFGLDSIDILEIALLISKKYGFELRSDNPDNEKIFATLGALSAYIAAHRTR
ncbi:phosphopantetheine-binding protein [Paraburkholderia sp.]|uniref:phosphopantetheine-binding protein n=1 Tax=Paraburkholderia sp. TaxID=1926495 RepID=UPI0025CEE29C|nr:phosphopantetheine-binding protein [Paraburkholderia sp.]